MALPSDRASFKAYALRNLGAPVIKINVDDDQVDDRIDEALQFWYDYNYDGTEKQYYKYQLQPADFTNKYITLPENIIGVVKIFDLSFIHSAIANPFNLQYQMYMSDLMTTNGVSLIPYYIAYQNMQFIQQILVGQVPIRYNKHNHKLFLDMDWTRFSANDFVLVEAYEVMDPDTYMDVWKDRVLLKYATALIKRQWGTNMSKYIDVELTGGIKFNGQIIKEEAVAEIKELEQAMYDSSLPPTDFIGLWLVGFLSIPLISHLLGFLGNIST
jgi:hypothetical protein